MAPAFVIQLHTVGPSSHYDLMLDAGAALATWRLEALPDGLTAGQSMPAQALPDHRRAYLTYEGPVSGDRGRVQIADRGLYRLIRRNKSNWFFTLRGRRVRGRFRLRRLVGDNWRLAAAKEDTETRRHGDVEKEKGKETDRKPGGRRKKRL